jgi:flagellar biosynthesis protein FlhG
LEDDGFEPDGRFRCPESGGGPRYTAKANVPRVISINAGRCTDGLTNASLNLATALSRLGRMVLLLETGSGDAGVGALPGLTREEVIANGAVDAMLVRVNLEALSKADLGTDGKLALLASLEDLARGFDLVLIGSSAGTYGNRFLFDILAEDIVVVVTPEPRSIKEAYAFISTRAKWYGRKIFKLLVDGVVSSEEGFEVYRRVGIDADRLTNISLEYLGYVIRNSAGRKEAVAGSDPDSEASRCYRDIAGELLGLPESRCLNGGIQLFWREILEGGGICIQKP